MKRLVSVSMVSVMLSLSVPAFAQGPMAKPSSEPLNVWVGITGILTVAAGAAMMGSYTDADSHDYVLDHKTYCVSEGENYFNMDDGPCYRSEPLTKAGLWTMAIGGGLALAGFWPVHRYPHPQVWVAPIVGKNVKGAKFTVKW